MSPTLWKYSTSYKSWLPLSPPSDLVNKCGFAAYQSHLVMIGTRIQQGKLHIEVYKLDEDKGWLRENIDHVPEIQSLRRNTCMSASSEGKYLIVAWIENEWFMLMIFNGQKWEEKKGPKSISIGCRPGVIAHSGMLYLSENYNSFIHIHVASLESLLVVNSSGNDSVTWKNSNNIPKGISCSNLTVFSNHITMVTLLSLNTACVLAFVSDSNSWVELGEMKCNAQTAPSIIGLQDGRLLLMGKIRVENEANHTSVEPQFGILEAMTNGAIINLCYCA